VALNVITGSRPVALVAGTALARLFTLPRLFGSALSTSGMVICSRERSRHSGHTLNWSLVEVDGSCLACGKLGAKGKGGIWNGGILGRSHG
jgi:hypothetical protein